MKDLSLLSGLGETTPNSFSPPDLKALQEANAKIQAQEKTRQAQERTRSQSNSFDLNNAFQTGFDFITGLVNADNQKILNNQQKDLLQLQNQGKTLDKELAELKPEGKGSGGGKPPPDNTKLYILGAVGAVAVLGIGFFMMSKKK